MKAFHLGAFEVMVVTDDRLSESGGGGGSGGAFSHVCVVYCARFLRRGFLSTERPLMEPPLSYGLAPTKGGGGGGGSVTKGSEGSCLIR